MSIPAPGTDVPPLVAHLAAGRSVAAIWRNDLGGVTYRFGDEVVKWFRGHHWEVDLAAEADRLTWAGQWAPVPEVMDHGRGRGGQWLRTRAIDAESAVHPSNAVDPASTVDALGRGLRRWHDRLPVAGCPYRWDIATRLDARPDPATGAVELAARADQVETDLVVCHGDACSPNFLVRHGDVVAYVDLGQLGVADRWADLAPALMSLEWNFGGGWQQQFLRAYGCPLDAEKLEFYSALWDLA